MLKILKPKEQKKEEIIPRKPEESDIKERPDRVGKYFKKYLSNFVFDEFSEAYLKREGQIDFMRGVPIPLRKEDIEAFHGGEGLKILHISENMAWIMGIDPQFEHTKTYMTYMEKYFNFKIVEGLVKEGRNAAEDKDLDNAAIHFRAALCMKPTDIHAMYSYARACRELYLGSDNEEYTGRFKAESLEYFELLVETHPKFPEAYYFLGYAYLNLGLYIKAQITWETFVGRSNNLKDKREIKNRLKQLAQPVEIETGYNAVLAGRWEEGINLLEPYLKSEFKSWWPLSYYLGVAYLSVGRNSEAVASLKRVLSINPSHVETMDELADIYAKSNDKENEKKYRNKAELIRSGGHKEVEEKLKKKTKKL